MRGKQYEKSTGAYVSMKAIRTDLAKEALAYIMHSEGVSSQDESVDGITINRVLIDSKIGEKNIGKPMGNYITVEAPELNGHDKTYEERLAKILSDEITKLCPDLAPNDVVLIAGLGNWKVTPDSLGPSVVKKIAVSRHITEYLPDEAKDLRPVCAIAPGVLGVTGMETVEVLKGICEKIKPKLVIAIDALASRATDRISTTIQLADTGIHPGSGVGNKRKALTQKTLGTQVIAIGVPTVVYASTISQDTVSMLLEEMGQEKQDQLFELVSRVVSDKIGELIVTPKEIDKIIDDCSTIISNGINMAIHGKTLTEVQRFLD